MNQKKLGLVIKIVHFHGKLLKLEEFKVVYSKENEIYVVISVMWE